MSPSATDAYSAVGTAVPYITGNFAPLMNEVTAFDLEVTDQIPETLNGRFLRIGPNPVDEPDPLWLKDHHWFTGAGMAHGLRLRDGKAEWFRSRFIVDEHTAEGPAGMTQVKANRVITVSPEQGGWQRRARLAATALQKTGPMGGR